MVSSNFKKVINMSIKTVKIKLDDKERENLKTIIKEIKILKLKIYLFRERLHLFIKEINT